MQLIETALFLLLAVVLSGWVARITRMPLPLVQIALGAGVVMLTGKSVDLRPEIFFLLFLPPLLFVDGWRIPKAALYRDRKVILELALGLVVFTVLGLGFFIHWMIPAMPLAVAFALSAILSPTDPIAVSAIAGRSPMPKRLMHILEGESLLNDATGLTCMRIAVIAATTGAFSLTHAVGTFAWLAVAGIAVGVVVSLSINLVKGFISRRWGEDVGGQILVSLLMPFAAYLAAEAIHASGILAAVAAGITMSFTEREGTAKAATRIRRAVVWDTVQFTANGLIFVILGEQMPSILARAAEVIKTTPQKEVWWLAVYVLAIVGVLATLRFIWVWATLRLTLFSRKKGTSERPKLRWRLVAVMSLSGVRGAITLAGILTLPFFVADGTLLPARNLAIFLAAGVIVVSLVVASVALPILLKGVEMPPEDHAYTVEDRARKAAALAAISALEQAERDAIGAGVRADEHAAVVARLMEVYRHQIELFSGADDNESVRNHQMEQLERELALLALTAQRTELVQLARKRLVDEETARKLIREIDLQEIRLV
ncbi:Na+/H+ antiporter [Brevundimonas terrae]|uniref:Na+/H+ antiporter n=1 Tax=Brevundimonas terrae TaxID=363631 RepID=A0ABP3IBQ7_9CAUL|nr:Na+/H+ antiporter [Brevundimonas terrae]NIJ27036.1 CPA1 family monovalent cation:H+ antiporter [Brevundimonas terrae]